MKFLLQVGHQLDLNVSWDGGAVDNVTYQVSAGSEGVVSVTSAGVVEGLSTGIGVIEFINGGVVVGSAIFEVLTAATYTAQQGIRDGSKGLVVGAAVVPQGPPPSSQISLNTMTAASQGGYTAFGQLISWARAYDAFNGSLYLGVDENGSSAHAAGTNDGNTPITTIGQILPEVKALTSFTLTTSERSVLPQFTVECSVDTTTGLNGTWATIFTSEEYPFEGPHPTYTLADGVVLTQLTPNMDNGVLTKTFTVANTTGFKAYRLKIEGHPSKIFTFRELVFYGY